MHICFTWRILYTWATSHRLAAAIKKEKRFRLRNRFSFPLLLTLGSSRVLTIKRPLAAEAMLRRPQAWEWCHRLEPGGGVVFLLMCMKTQACCKANSNITIAVFKKLVVIILSTITSANHEGGIWHKRKLVIVFQAHI